MAKKKEKPLDREEYGYGYDLSPDDLDVIGQNEQEKKPIKMKTKENRRASKTHPF